MEETKVNDGCTTFSHFPKLPPELRIKIWHHALEYQPKTALHPYKKGCWRPRWLTKSEEGFDHQNAENNLAFEFRLDKLGEARMKVPVAFVNTEAQNIAIAWAQKLGSPIRVCTNRRHPIFLRAFDTDRDALYVTQSQWNDFTSEPEMRVFEHDLIGKTLDIRSDVTRLAIPTSMELRDLHELFEQYDNVEILYIILDAPPDLDFQPPKYSKKKRSLWECETSHRAAWRNGHDWVYAYTDETYQSATCPYEPALVQRACEGFSNGFSPVPEGLEIHVVSKMRCPQ